MIALPGCNDPFIGVSDGTSLVTSFGLHCLSVKCSNIEDGKLTGIPHGETGSTFPFDLPLPPPWGWSPILFQRDSLLGKSLLTGVHSETSDCRPDVQPPLTTGLTKLCMVVVGIAGDTHRRTRIS